MIFWFLYGYIYCLSVWLEVFFIFLWVLFILKMVNFFVVLVVDEFYFWKFVFYCVEWYFYFKFFFVLFFFNFVWVVKYYFVVERVSNDSLFLEDLNVEFFVLFGSGLGLEWMWIVLKWLVKFYVIFWGFFNDFFVFFIFFLFKVLNFLEV